MFNYHYFLTLNYYFTNKIYNFCDFYWLYNSSEQLKCNISYFYVAVNVLTYLMYNRFVNK